ncbi:MAG: pyruvate kinase [Oscillospiraceae bacterium]|nr:pyruvate kinase [Oscillospiraceae bacterium]
MRKTKIVCTLGPSTNSPEIIRQLMLAGMNVARFNFSHGDHESHKATFDIVKQCREKLSLPVATMLDTQGPEIRIRTFKEGKAELKAGEIFTLTTRELEGSGEIVSISYKDLPKDVSSSSAILIDDGLIALTVERVTETDIICKIRNGGVISNRKSVNVPSVHLSMPYLSEKDKGDLLFGIETGFDYIAASFARSAEDVWQIRQLLRENKAEHIKIIAKIENYEGVENIEGILNVADGLMVARGDLGVEVPFEDIPAIQKKLIKKTFLSGKPVITATQMLDSMIKNPRPTRAEATDVANAIYDGTSAIMLSGETAAGAYPIEAVRTMEKITLKTEADINYRKKFYQQSESIDFQSSVTEAISHATCTTAYDLGAKAVITVTKSGTTARMISKYRPSMPIMGCTPVPVVYRQLSLTWGVVPVMVENMTDSEKLFKHAVEMSEKTGALRSGDLVVITAGLPLGYSGTTNMLRVFITGDILTSGTGIGSKVVCANLCVVDKMEDLESEFNDGDIIVIPKTGAELLPYMRRASGVIAEEGGHNSYAAIAGSVLDIPVIIGAHGATQVLKKNTTVTLDSGKGIVHNRVK